MAWCPITKTDCRSDCAWFRENRRRYPDGRQNGKCSLMEMGYITDRLKEINDNVKSLEKTISDENFTE